MADLFHAFTTSTSSSPLNVASDETDEKLLNTELDDIPMPEGARLPTKEETLKTLEAVNRILAAKKAGASDDKSLELGAAQSLADPDVAKGQSYRVNSSQAIDDESSGPDSDNDHPDLSQDKLDLLSSASEVNDQRKVITKLHRRIRDLELKLGLIVDLDSKVRMLDFLTNEHTSRLDSAASAYSNLASSFSTYQSNMASKMADLERRMATKQLKIDAKAEEESVVPPSSINIQRLLPLNPPSSTDNELPAKQIKKRANIDAF